MSHTSTRRVAIIGEANAYSGPALAKVMAERGHDLVLGDASPGLVEEVTAMGARAVDVTGTNHLLEASGSQRLVDAALAEFGRLDAATTATGVIVTGALLGKRVRNKFKDMPYESGMAPIGSARERFSVKFYMVAISFIMFDLETVSLMPWAIVAKEFGGAGLAAAMFFVGVLVVGLIYEWRKGGLEWE